MPAWPKTMSEFERQHPIAAVSRALGLIRGNFITILIFLFVGAQSDNFPFLWWIGGGFGLLLVLGIANWWRFLYKIEDGTLHIKSGIFVRKDLYLTKDRIQVIDITAGVLQRMFGLVRLDIQTAGSSSRQAAIDAITRDKAAEVNRMLREVKSASAENPEDAEQEALSLQPETIKKIKLPAKELLIAASTSGSFGIALSIIATVFSQIEPLISESELFEYLFGLLPSQTDTMMIITVIAVFVVFAWLLSFFSTLFTYGNFQIDVKEKEIVVSRGIFEKKRITVPFNRIQAIHVREGIIRQPLGYASVHLESAGYGDDKVTGSIVLYPLIRIQQLKNLLNDVVPDYDKIFAGTRPPTRSARRYIFRSAFLVTAITAIVYWYLALNLWIWILPIVSLFWGWKKYKDAAFGWDEEMLLMRGRRLSRSTAFIKKKRVQDAAVTQSPFQRMRNLATIRLFVASGRGKSFQVRDLELEDARLLLKHLKKNGISVEDKTETPDNANYALPGWA